jgi:hypothetical protein
MTRRRRSAVRHLRFAAAAALLTVAGCASATTSLGPRQGTPLPSSSPPALAPGPSAPAGSALATGVSACALISADEAAAALGMPVGKGQPVPGTKLSNGAVGGSCIWTDSAGGTAVVVILEYPSPTVARRVFSHSKAPASGARPVHLPDLAPSEYADTGTYGTTTIAQSFLLDGNRELSVTINQPSGPGSRFSVPAFVTFVRQAAQAWR